jgi:trehalose 6-phosphate phosphatase
MTTMDLAEIATSVRRALPDILVALDFDGTLAPIVPDPKDSRPVAGTTDALAALTRRGATVAVITGRDAQTVVRLGGLEDVPGVLVEGIYGIEQWQSGTLTTPPEPESMQRVRAELPKALADGDPALWIEDKRLSLVVHARKAADPEAALEHVRPAIERLAQDLGLEPHPGKGVVELRLPGYDKAGALRRLVDEAKPRAVLFVGDDVGDLPAFAEAKALRRAGTPAYGIAVGSTEAPDVLDAADLHVESPEAVVALLRSIGQDETAAS